MELPPITLQQKRSASPVPAAARKSPRIDGAPNEGSPGASALAPRTDVPPLSSSAPVLPVASLRLMDLPEEMLLLILSKTRMIDLSRLQQTSRKLLRLAVKLGKVYGERLRGRGPPVVVRVGMGVGFMDHGSS